MEDIYQLISHLNSRIRYQTPKTYLEIAGHPNLESVSSNILAFYLDPYNQHQYGNKVFRSFMKLLGEENPREAGIKVSREVSTHERKRIDIVAQTGFMVLGIENKIHHTLQNDLQAYWSHLQSISRGRTVYAVLLSLRETELPSDSPFINVTYDDLFDCIEYITEYPKTRDVFFEDFIQTIRNLSGESKMNEGQLRFLRDHKDEIEFLLREMADIRSDMRKRLQMVQNIIGIPQEFIPNEKRSETTEVKEVLAYTKRLDKSTFLKIEVCLDITGWTIQFSKSESKGDRWKIQQVLDDLQIPYTTEDNPWRLIFEGERLEYHTDARYVADWALQVISPIIRTIN